MTAALALVAACGGEEPAGEADDRAAAVLRARTEGLRHLQQDRLDSAEARFRELAEIAPEESAGPANLALVDLRRGDGERAVEHARRARELAPDDPWVHLVVAEAFEARGRPDSARAARRRALEIDPGNLRALWSLAGGAEAGGSVEPAERRRLLDRLVERDPSNAPARLALAGAELAGGETAAAARQLEEVLSLRGPLPEEARPAFEEALSAARSGDREAARRALERLRERMRMTAGYQSDLEALEPPRGEATGFADLTFSHELSVEVPDEGAVLEALRFTDATGVAGLDTLARGTAGAGGRAGPGSGEAVVAVGDVDGDRTPDLFAWTPAAGGRLLRNEQGAFADATPPAVEGLGAVRAAAFVDADGDGRLDLYVARRGADRLFRNAGDGELEDVSSEAGVAVPGSARVVVAVDLDHDGDLDLVLGGADGGRVLRNDGDGGFPEAPDAMGLFAGPGPVEDVGYADLDGDADLDLVAARGGRGLELYANLREGRFAPVTDSAGADGIASAGAVAVGDYDNDGSPDLAVSTGDRPAVLLRNRGDGRFARDRGAGGDLPAPGAAGADVAFVDVDNDGRLDLVLGGGRGAGGIRVLHNEGDGAFADLSSRLLPDPRPPARRLAVFDHNGDGDRDLLAVARGGPRLLRNDGGDANHHLRLRLRGRGPGSGKVNRFGVGSRVDVRAGDLRLTRTVRGPETQFGLGHRLKADVVRIVWTNGVPQHLYFPGTDEDVAQQQRLKGSCAFVYAWNGDRYEFVTDAVWRSALGMPLGIMGGPEGSAPGTGQGGAAPADGEGASGAPGGSGRAATGRRYAPPGASREYVRIGPDQLAPRSGRYRLQLTEELWEVGYVDEVKLLAVDHPDSVEVWVDEAFAPPAPPELRLYRVADRLPPASARDGAGDDLLPTLRARDHRYVSDLVPGPHQGIVEPHEVVLELPPEAVRAGRTHLFLRGWVFPTDASINVAVAQSDSLSVDPPRLSVPDGDGGWRPVGPVGFPSGKDKTVVVDVSGVVPPEDPRVRIRTNMQVYWDHAFFAADADEVVVEGDAREAAARWKRASPAGGTGPGPAPRLLRPVEADLHVRGFSREYRKGGRHGPHWFDYDDVSTRSPWLAIPGRYTRYGDVLPLLGAADDRYVVMGPGDEMTVEFDAPPPEDADGWSRTFLLYTDGWIKDADLNTAAGDSVGPLPFHGQSRYPHAPGEGYPRDSVHRAYLETYQTRVVPGPAVPPPPSAP